jgi:GNAT superfamily N-acetyltransferase
MSSINFQILQPTDQQFFTQIANWYFSEWQIPVNATIERLKSLTADKGQFQALMLFDGKPIATGGVYDHVGLLDKKPALKVYKKWLALVYTIPGERGRGYGAALCNYIHNYCHTLGFEKIYLFTHTAKTLYQRLGWKEQERFLIHDRDIVVMEKSIF